MFSELGGEVTPPLASGVSVADVIGLDLGRSPAVGAGNEEAKGAAVDWMMVKAQAMVV
jgi:hypothetical protein